MTIRALRSSLPLDPRLVWIDSCGGRGEADTYVGGVPETPDEASGDVGVAGAGFRRFGSTVT